MRLYLGINRMGNVTLYDSARRSLYFQFESDIESLAYMLGRGERSRKSPLEYLEKFEGRRLDTGRKRYHALGEYEALLQPGMMP